MYQALVGKHLPNSPSNPVKVAVLDTGIEKGHPLIDPRRDRLPGQKNFYNASQNGVADTHGHGTFTGSLIMDYAPDASLYIAKIADKDNAAPDASIVAGVS